MRKTTEDYLKAIYTLKLNKPDVHAVDIADYFSVSKPTVSMHVKNLSKEGFIYVNSSHEIFLTDKGKAIASSVIDKNKIFKQLLEELGVNQEIAEEDACKLEHAISPESYTALKKLTTEYSPKKHF